MSESDNCRVRCPYAMQNPETEGIDECSGKGLGMAEIMRDNPRFNILPVCLVVKRTVTWEGEILDMPEGISERVTAVRAANADRWNELFDKGVRDRGKEMTDYVKRLDTDEVYQPYDRDGFQVAVAAEWKAWLRPLMALGLSLEEAGEHFYRTRSTHLAEEITDQVVWERSRQFNEQ